MNEDDMTNWYPELTKEDKERLRADEQRLISSVPVLQDVLDWFERQLLEYTDPRTILGVNAASDAEQVKRSVLLAQGFAAEYQKKRDEFATTFAQYIKEEEA